MSRTSSSPASRLALCTSFNVRFAGSVGPFYHSSNLRQGFPAGFLFANCIAAVLQRQHVISPLDTSAMDPLGRVSVSSSSGLQPPHTVIAVSLLRGWFVSLAFPFPPCHWHQPQAGTSSVDLQARYFLSIALHCARQLLSSLRWITKVSWSSVLPLCRRMCLHFGVQCL